jgi:formylmethanofuran dehydrogenase subunit E
MAAKQEETTRECTKCHVSVPWRETRGAQNGKWLCVPCWEEEYQRPAPDENQERVAKL